MEGASVSRRMSIAEPAHVAASANAKTQTV
jgi:hypothetical protein